MDSCCERSLNLHNQKKQMALQKNTVLRLLDVDKNREAIKITILSTLGEGSNCIAYDVEYDGSVRGVLKECWSAKLATDIYRKNFVPKLANESLKEVFIDSLKKFESDYRDNVTFLKENEEITNYVPQHVGLFRTPEFIEGQSGTLYSLYQKDRGDSLSKDPPKSAHEVFGIAKSAAKGLELFHKKGRVYLDFKADNLFVFPSEEDNHQVKFFDADASVDIKTLYDDEEFSFFSTMDWEAPEMIKVRNAIEEGKDDLKLRKNIDKRTDFYLVGLLVDRLLNIGFQACQHNPSSWEYNSSNSMLKNLDSRIRRKLQAFFEQTISPARNKRYATDQELIDALDDLYTTALADGPRINNHDHTLKPSKLKHEFVGRDAELAKMYTALNKEDNTTVFLWGIGGIGKSELALQYVNKYKKDYDCVVSVFYQDDLATCLMDGNIIANFSYIDNKTKEQKFADFYNKLQGLCQTTKVLLIIDNFDTSYDSHFDKLHEPCDILKLNCDKIFTTRHDYREKFPSCVIEIDTIRDVEGKLDFEALKRIFYYNGPIQYREALLNNCPIDPTEDDIVRQLVEHLDGHILTIELLGLQLRHSRKTIGLKEMFERLKASIDGKYNVSFEHRMSKSKNPKETSYEHLSATFNIFKEDINEEAKEILGVLTYIPQRGIRIATLLRRCGFEGDNGVESLNEIIKRGWVKENEAFEIVSLHPVISEVLFEEMRPRLEEKMMAQYINAWMRTFKIHDQHVESVVFFMQRVWCETEDSAILLGNLGHWLFRKEHFEEALASQKKALDILGNILPSDHRDVLRRKWTFDVTNYCKKIMEINRNEEVPAELVEGIKKVLMLRQIPGGDDLIETLPTSVRLRIDENVRNPSSNIFPHDPVWRFLEFRHEVDPYIPFDYWDRKVGRAGKPIEESLNSADELIEDLTYLSCQNEGLFHYLTGAMCYLLEQTDAALAHSKIADMLLFDNLYTLDSYEMKIVYEVLIEIHEKKEQFDNARKYRWRNKMVTKQAEQRIHRYFDEIEMAKALPIELQILQEQKKVLPNNHRALENTHLQLAKIYRVLGQEESAIDCEANAKKVSRNLLPVNYVRLVSYYNNLSIAYHEMGRYQTSKSYFLHATDLLYDMEDMYYNHDCAFYYYKLQENDLAIKHFESAEPLLKKYDDKARLIKIYEKLIEIYTHLEQPQNAKTYAWRMGNLYRY